MFDNLSTGFEDVVIGAEFVQGDIHDSAKLDEVFIKYNIDVVMHFAVHIDIGESVHDPFKYYRNNVVGTQALLERMVSNNISSFIFSSTAAIFGEPEYVPIDEAHSKKPINPYGHSKLIVEQMLESYDQAYGLKSVCLRYFNAAGADPKTRIGERHDPETHLIPLVLQAASGRRESINVFGDDYDTDDDTCLRDYIQIVDLYNAHLLSAKLWLKENTSRRFNLGNGSGYTVKQLIELAKQITKVNQSERREGDPAKLVADATFAKKALNWLPKYLSLEEIIEHAWKWELKQSHR